MFLTKLTPLLQPATPRNAVVAAVACVAASALLRAALDPLLPPSTTFTTFWIGIDVATVIAGWRAGALGVVLSALVGWYFWLEPRYSFEMQPGRASFLVLYVVLASLQVVLAALMREALLRAQKMREERDLVVRELAHRIRNHFSLFNSIAMQTLRTSSDVGTASTALQGRLKALMLGLDLAAVNGETTLEFAELVSKVVLPLAPAPHRLVIETVSALVRPEQVHAVALVLHELGTNAIKHGAWAGDDGVVQVSVNREAGKVCLQWCEAGISVPGSRSGFGNVLIARAIPDAEVEIRPGPPYTVVITLDA